MCSGTKHIYSPESCLKTNFVCLFKKNSELDYYMNMGLVFVGIEKILQKFDPSKELKN